MGCGCSTCALLVLGRLRSELSLAPRERWPRLVTEFGQALRASGLTDLGVLGLLLQEAARELGLGDDQARRWLEGARTVSDVLVRLEDGLAHQVSRPPTPSGRNYSPIVARALAMINEGGGSSISVLSLARALACSSRTLRRRFLSEVGRTPQNYITAMRVRRATELLLDGEKVDAVAGMVGYRSRSALVRLLRRHTGVGPSALRRAGRFGHPDWPERTPCFP